jgi:hypothetical protein
MKLASIATAQTLIETNHGMWKARDDIATQQSAQNLVIAALQKIRNMLGPMGLTKATIQKHRATEPIGPAVGPFSTLRRAVHARVNQDALMLLNGQGDRESIGRFWGIQFPTDWHDVDAGQRGKVNAEGEFDKLIRQTVAASEGQPMEARIELLARLAEQIS